MVGVVRVLVGVLGVLFRVLGVLVDVFFIGMAYLMSLGFRMVFLLHEMEHLIFGIHYLVTSQK